VTASVVSERALVVAPCDGDAALAAETLREGGIEALVCPSLEVLVRELQRGAGFAVLAEEAIAAETLRSLSDWLGGQEAWSDLPLVLLTRRSGDGEDGRTSGSPLELLGNVTYLERPFHPKTLMSLARSALRGRRRQYEARERLLALQESEARYRTLFDTMDEGFCVIEFLDGPHGPLSDYVHVQANPAYERHAGIPDVVGRKVRDMVPDEAGAWVELYRRVLLTGEPVRFERELVATGRHLELASFRVEPSSRREVAVIFQDVTARKRAEQALRDLNDTLERRVEEAVTEREAARAKLHEAQKLDTLGQLTGGVAHDINNLLTPITGALDLLNRRYADGDARAARLLDGALQSAERARILVSRLLGFARRQTLETRAIDVAAILEGMHDLVASSVGSSIELRFAADHDLPPVVADPNQLELAILNLCVNARDAMEGGGVLTIAAERALAGPGGAGNLKPGAYVRLSVIDTGTGMDEATLARAVEPFFSTKGVGRGTGLGLSMVHGLVGQLGGSFALTSVLGEGTRADLFLPVAAMPAQPFSLRHSAPVPKVRPLSVLLVDDEELVRAGTAEMLREMGHSVHEASGGAQALRMLGSGLPIDAVVTDYMMPHINGAELAERARALQAGLPVLVVTGYAKGGLDLSFPQLAKPFRQADLAAAVEKLVRSTPPRRAALTVPGA
jgi:PAS domain S-box-containing protein